jgi:uncharacterized membrane protein YhiD involved in acid resistance
MYAMPAEWMDATSLDLAAKLGAAGVIGGLIGFERRSHHKPIGIAGMIMTAIALPGHFWTSLQHFQ